MKFKHNKNIMASLSKLSKAFMLPIALLPIAGLFLGIGSSLISQAQADSTMWWLGRTFKMIGNIPFTNLPALFAISIAIAYTNNSGVAGLTGFIGWIVYNAFIAVFMQTGQSVWEINATFKLNWRRYPNNGSMLVNVSNTNFTNYVFTMKDVGYIPPHESIASVAGGFAAPQLGMKEALAGDLSAKLSTNISANDITIFEPTSIIRKALNYNLFYWKDSIAVDPSIVTPILGVGTNSTGMGKFGGSLNTGVFGGLIVGAVVAYLYNRYYNIQLPKVISFFGGVRFVPIITFLMMIPLGLLTMMIWPGFGVMLNGFGKWTGTLPIGLDSFVYGLGKRALLPFGLHHVFYAPLWWSGAGGQLSSVIQPEQVRNAATLTAQGDQSMIMAILADGKLKLQDVWSSGLHVGRFLSGEFAMMMIALPVLAIVMWVSIPKQNRRTAMGIYISAAITSMLTGITEPLEFTFLFVVPLVYYAIHVPIFASSYMIANVLGIKVGLTFSGGMLDWIIFGIIPTFAGHDTKWWLIPIVGLGYAILEGTIFYFLIKKFKWDLPGMNIENIKLFTKADYINKKDNIKIQGGQRTLDIIDGLGGLDNLESVDACATRLRVLVINSKKVNVSKLKTLGAIAVVISKNAIQSVFGGEADNIKSNILNYQKDQKEQTIKIKNTANIKKVSQ